MYERNKGYVIVTDYVEPDTGADLSDALQELILANPHKTIFFPDGEYALSKPICTPADPNKSVALELANYAIIKPTEEWNSDEALIRLGGVEPFNSIGINGSNYYLRGGIIDGCGIAAGISIDSGRETSIKQVSIKHTTIGINIKRGANNGSSDADIYDVNIVGNGKAGSIGVLVEGYDNTLTNMRIASVQYGVKFLGGGNSLRNIHPLYIFTPELTAVYRDSVAFEENAGGNWFNFCYSDQFATGFVTTPRSKSVYSDCYAMWYTAKGDKEVGWESRKKFNGILRNCSVNFHGDSKPEFNAYIKVGEEGGSGFIDTPLFREELVGDKTYEKYLHGPIIFPR